MSVCCFLCKSKQVLLLVARVRVRDALAKQSGPEADRWWMCVRTYGRQGEPRSDSPAAQFLAERRPGLFKGEGLEVCVQKLQA